MRHFRHILICSAIILTIIGCEKTEIIGGKDQTGKNSVTYTTKVAETKAVITDEAKLKQDGFNIATFLTDNNNTHYYTDKVNYTNSVWQSDSKRYWPVEYNMNVYAYSPKNNNVTINNSNSFQDYSLTYKCPSNIEEQIDLMARTLKNVAPSDEITPGPIDIEFLHLLSGIKFNVEFKGEKNITLENIVINYVNIEKQRTFNFIDSTWVVPAESDRLYYNNTDNDALSTILPINDTKEKDANGTIIFNNIKKQLMIIPQKVSLSETDPHYLSIQINYTLKNGLGDPDTPVMTGVMALPVPNDKSEYFNGINYTYNIKVNGKEIYFDKITIEDQAKPVPAYGNIDLELIDTRTNPSDIEGFTPSDATNADKEQFYYTTALRVKKLLLSGVRDFVVVGSMNASGTEDHLGDGKLGFYGASTSPFTIGADLAKAESGEDYELSVDLRGTYDHPEFQYANNDTGSGDTGSSTPLNSDIQKDDEILIAGLFSKVKSLTEIILPHDIMAIGNHAFEDCDKLRTIDITDVKHIEVGAFQHSSNLVTVKNGNLTRIHDNGFDKCTSLTTIDLSKVTQIDKFGFVNCSNLTNVDLSELTTIGDHAFNGCSALTIQKDTKFDYVADYAFSGCSKISTGRNKERIDLTTAIYVGDHAFNECTEILLTSGYLSEMLNIGPNAFSKCRHIGSNFEIHLPKINSIGSTAFAYCDKINVVEGLDRLNKISREAFMSAASFTGYSKNNAPDAQFLNLPNADSVGVSAFYDTAITDVRFNKDKFTRVYDYAFNSCSKLVSISGLENVNTTGINAFANCPKLEKLVLNSLTDENCAGGLFAGSSGIKELSLPLLKRNDASWSDDHDGDGELTTTITSIIEMATNCRANIEIINLPLLEAEIGNFWYGFQNAKKLHTANLNKVTKLGDGAFQNCNLLKNINLSSVDSIGSYTFQNCTSLEELILPKVTEFGSDFFSGCTSLKKLEMTILDNQNIISQVKSSSLETVILPSITGKIGGDWGGIFAIYDESVEGKLRSNLTLKYIDFSSVNEVGNETFRQCENLLAVDLSNATIIGECVFQSCNNLQRIDLSGLVDNAKINNGKGDGPFWNFTNGANCEIWLSDEQYEVAYNAASDKSSVKTWQNCTWKAIHKASETSFTLIAE